MCRSLRPEREQWPGPARTLAGSIPEVYDSYLVPLIFEAFAADHAGRIAATGPA